MKSSKIVMGMAVVVLALTMTACGSAAPSQSPSPSAHGAGAGALRDRLPADIASKGSLTVAISDQNKPLSFRDTKSGDLQGFGIDLVDDYARRLGVKVDFQIVNDISARIPGLQGNRYDVVAGIGARPELTNQLTFVEWFQEGAALLVQAKNPHKVAGLDEMCGKRVAIVSGSLHTTYVPQRQQACKDAGKPEIAITQVPDTSSGQLALASDRVDAFWTNISIATGIVGEHPKDFKISGDVLPLVPNAFGVLSSRNDLVKALQAAEQAAYADGTYQKTLEHWNFAGIGLKEFKIIEGGK